MKIKWNILNLTLFAGLSLYGSVLGQDSSPSSPDAESAVEKMGEKDSRHIEQHL